MTRKLPKAAPDPAAPATEPRDIDPARRPQIEDASARAAAKASIAAGFPAPQQYADQLGEDVIAALEAEVAAEQAAAAATASAGEPETNTQTGEG